MSPEQAEGKLIDHRTDLWSLGIILHEMVTGRRAFDSGSVPATLYAIVHSPPSAMDDGGSYIGLLPRIRRSDTRVPPTCWRTFGRVAPRNRYRQTREL
jgi:serine/threonine protein kinase